MIYTTLTYNISLFRPYFYFG